MGFFFSYMKYQIGDKVRFLNSKEKGLVVKYIATNIVMVDIENGFEIPVAESELVMDSFPTEAKDNKVATIAVEEEFIKTEIDSNQLRKSQSGRLFVSFTAVDKSKPASSDLLVYFINTTSYYIDFNYYFTKAKQHVFQQNMQCFPNSRIKLFHLKRSDVHEYRNMKFQVLFRQYDTEQLLPPVQAELKIKQDKLFQDKYFEQGWFGVEKEVLFDVYNLHTADVLSEDELRLRIENTKIEIKDQPKNNFNPKGQFINSEPEIDLHIEELIDNISGMSNGEIVQIQMRYFHQHLSAAMASKAKKLTVIHGVGNGRLKAEVYKAVQQYPKLKIQDASYAKYGYGASDVIIY